MLALLGFGFLYLREVGSARDRAMLAERVATQRLADSELALAAAQLKLGTGRLVSHKINTARDLYRSLGLPLVGTRLVEAEMVLEYPPPWVELDNVHKVLDYDPGTRQAMVWTGDSAIELRQLPQDEILGRYPHADEVVQGALGSPPLSQSLTPSGEAYVLNLDDNKRLVESSSLSRLLRSADDQRVLIESEGALLELDIDGGEPRVLATGTIRRLLRETRYL